MNRLIWITMLSVTIGLLSQPSMAGPREGMRSYSLENAVSRARNQYQGRVISAETDRNGDRRTHNIRILTEDGHLKRLRVDPKTGEYVRPRPRNR